MTPLATTKPTTLTSGSAETICLILRKDLPVSSSQRKNISWYERRPFYRVEEHTGMSINPVMSQDTTHWKN